MVAHARDTSGPAFRDIPSDHPLVGTYADGGNSGAVTIVADAAPRFSGSFVDLRAGGSNYESGKGILRQRADPAGS